VGRHAVQYDADRRLWFADVEIDAGPTDNAFVRLALARFQPNSLDGCHLSRVVLADFAQLTPDRSASLIYDPTKNTAALTVTGHSRYTFASTAYNGTRVVGPTIEATLETRSSGSADPAAWTPVLKKDGSSSDGDYDPGTEGPPPRSGTPVPPRRTPPKPKPVPQDVPYTRGLDRAADGSPFPATATFYLPQPRGSAPYRVVIREYEVMPDDTSYGQRLVYADAIELP
jgi:hypothetical protein